MGALEPQLTAETQEYHYDRHHRRQRRHLRQRGAGVESHILLEQHGAGRRE
jgi:superoxide dismutase